MCSAFILNSINPSHWTKDQRATLITLWVFITMVFELFTWLGISYNERFKT